MWTDLTRTRRHGTNLKERGAARMLESSLLTTTTQKPVPEPTSSAAKSISVDLALVLFVTGTGRALRVWSWHRGLEGWFAWLGEGKYLAAMINIIA